MRRFGKRKHASYFLDWSLLKPKDGAHPEFSDVVELCRVPSQHLVRPLVVEPDVRRQNLVFLVLWNQRKYSFLKLIILFVFLGFLIFADKDHNCHCPSCQIWYLMNVTRFRLFVFSSHDDQSPLIKAGLDIRSPRKNTNLEISSPTKIQDIWGAFKNYLADFFR